MKEKVFVRKNIFTCVMFGALLLFVVYESIASNIDLSVLSFFIAIPTFLLSLIKLVVDILEDVNDTMTNFLRQTENRGDDTIDWSILELIRENDDNDIADIVSEYTELKSDGEWIQNTLNQYHKARITRNNVRKMRRFFLYIYYGIFMIMLVMLLLHSELSSFVNVGVLSGIDLNIFTIWSLIIILLEIMMKDIFEDIIVLYLDKKMGTNLDWH